LKEKCIRNSRRLYCELIREIKDDEEWACDERDLDAKGGKVNEQTKSKIDEQAKFLRERYEDIMKRIRGEKSFYE